MKAFAGGGDSAYNQKLANEYGSNGHEAVAEGDYKVTVTLNNNTGYTSSSPLTISTT